MTRSIDCALDPATFDGSLVDRARELLAEPEVAAALDVERVRLLRAGDPGTHPADREPNGRELYRLIGRNGLLAPAWPREYGGSGSSLRTAAAIIELFVGAGLPDTLHVLSVQIVGAFLLRNGTEEQRRRYLPGLASGALTATVLYTEEGAGSDLSSLAGTARRTSDGGYVLDAIKVHGMKAVHSDLALCALRTSEDTYTGISLFLIDLQSPAVNRANLTSVGDEQLDRVVLNGLRVDEGDRVGAEGAGWALLADCLPLERTGLDYAIKSLRWHRAAETVLDADADADEQGSAAGGHSAADLARWGTRAVAGRLLVDDLLEAADAGRLDPTQAAGAKLYTSQTAQDIAFWSATNLPCVSDHSDHVSHAAAILGAAYREAPGLTLAAGTSQMMLEIVAAATETELDEQATEGTPEAWSWT